MTALSRRTLLAAPGLLLARRCSAATLQSGVTSAVSLELGAPDQAVFRAGGIVGAVALPQARARIAMWLPIAGREIVGIAFAADPPGGMLDLLALIGWDGACLRVLGLEIWNFAGADGASLASRFAGVGDRTRIRISRTAGIPRPGLPKRWETWIDLLSWQALSPLADAPVRTPLPGTQQAELAGIRAQVIESLSPACQAITPAQLAEFCPVGAVPPQSR
jgi:hypothetical protein